MTTPNQTINTLAARWCELVVEQEQLMCLIENPVCGKPGHGFKAAGKAKAAKRAIDQQLAAFSNVVNDWISRKHKADNLERIKRYEQLQQAIRTKSCATLGTISINDLRPNLA